MDALDRYDDADLDQVSNAQTSAKYLCIADIMLAVNQARLRRLGW
jgi:hypothetical protein